MKVKNYHHQGFSLVELVTVIVLLGIVSVLALGRFTDSQSIAARGFFEDSLNAMRFAQKLAISSGCPVRVITSSNSFQLWQSNTCSTSSFTIAVRNPADRANPYLNANLPAGYSLNTNTVTFNSRGTIDAGSPDPIPFTISGGCTSCSFNVNRSTGLVD